MFPGSPVVDPLSRTGNLLRWRSTMDGRLILGVCLWRSFGAVPPTSGVLETSCMGVFTAR